MKYPFPTHQYLPGPREVVTDAQLGHVVAEMALHRRVLLARALHVAKGVGFRKEVGAAAPHDPLQLGQLEVDAHHVLQDIAWVALYLRDAHRVPLDVEVDEEDGGGQLKRDAAAEILSE